MGVFEKIISSEFLVAMNRARNTDIPYSKEIAELIEEEARAAMPLWKVMATAIPKRLRKNRSMAYVELRSASVNEAISRLEDPVILEIGAGLCPRGLEWTLRGITYVESDLPEAIKRKERVVKQIRANEGRDITPNHHFLPLNIYRSLDFNLAGRYISSVAPEKPIAVIHEGVFPYLDPAQQAAARDNIAYFLRTYSPKGAWITSDFSYLTDNESFFNLLFREVMELRRGLPQTLFRNDDEVQGFFREAGLEGHQLPNSHLVDRLTCIARGANPKAIEKFARDYQAYFISLLR